MPGAWGQLGLYPSKLPTDPAKDGTIVLASTRHQKCYPRVYETPRATDEMLSSDGAFSVLSDLGTICGDEVGQPCYAGSLPMTRDDILLLSEDVHGLLEPMATDGKQQKI